jgi:N-acetyl-gamma-glutamylphosphate reductase
MSKSNATENDLVSYIFKGTAIPWAAATELDIHLHTADPTESGASTAFEATYGNYALVTVNRNAGAWTVSGNEASNAALVQFNQCDSGSNTITHVSITPEGSTQILYSGALGSPLSVSNGIQPQFAIGALTITED